ncbi:hypothetical protein [Nostoc sp. JL23]|uniref:hypothetical protein n=1 Tax=Nostoc sp. JL23 TaxID=2815394 RepID=UPI001DF8FA47|nr:hypothetical protein [Nostoc sp. JL23]MBN3875184.1 hypothetical protein [Nostoc sp. JL23]
MNLVCISGIFSALAISLFGLTGVATAQTPSQLTGEQTALPQCYMQTADGKTIDLGSFCGAVAPPNSYQQNNYAGSYSGHSSSSYSGNCQYSWQVDSSGKICGDRSTKSHPGDSYGGYNSNYIPSYTPSYSGSTSGVCNVPSDIARDGSRCGGRAASERRGGR